MYCSFCGKEIEESMKFCPHCGKANVMMSANSGSGSRTETADALPGQEEEKAQEQMPEQKEEQEEAPKQPQKQTKEQQRGQSKKEPQGKSGTKEKINWSRTLKTLNNKKATPADVTAICTGRLSLVFCILLTLSLLLQISSYLNPVTVITIFPTIIICIGCWIACIEGRRKEGVTLGLSLISGGITVYLAVFAVIGGICALAGVVFTIRGIFTIEFWTNMITFALIGAAFGILLGLLVGLLSFFLAPLGKNEIAEKVKQDKKGYARYLVVGCVAGSVGVFLVFGLLYSTFQNNPGAFVFLLLALVAYIPISYWYYFRQTTVSAGKIVRAESSEWRVNNNAVTYLLIVACYKIFVLRLRSVIVNGLYSFMQQEFFADFPKIVTNLFRTFILPRFIPSKSSSAAGLISLAVVICAIILIWQITRIGRSDKKAQTQAQH